MSHRLVVVLALALAAVSVAACQERVLLTRDAALEVDGDIERRDGDASAAADGDGALRVCTITDAHGITGLGDYAPLPAGRWRLLVAGAYYWRSTSPTIWQERGHLSAILDALPVVDGRRVWDGSGVTAIAWRGYATHLYSRDLHWRLDSVGATSESGHASVFLPPSPPTVSGLLPWEGEGITGVDLHDTQRITFFSGPRFYRYTDSTSPRWTESGTVDVLWPALPPVEGAYPWDPPGVTGYHDDGATRTILSGDRYWVVDHVSGDALEASGLASEHWADVPAIEVPCE